jgi:tetratricopeptide (TPR) repeat protein
MFLVVVLTVWGHGYAAGARLQGPVHELALKSIDLVYQERFEEALGNARKIIRLDAQHPAGYFFYAVTLDAQMAFEQSARREDEFYQYCDLTIQKSEALLGSGTNAAWANFFLGGAEGLKGNYETRFERWITAFRYGWKGVTILRKAQELEPQLFDVCYGIGTYNYWRSAMTQVMRWMPGVKDTRAEGIEEVRKSLSQGVYTQIASAVNLIEIYYNEKRYLPMHELAQRMLERYPNNYLFLMGEARSQFYLGRIDEAEVLFKRAFTKASALADNNGYTVFMTSYWLLKLYQSAGRFPQCREQHRHLSSLKLDPEVSKRLEPYRLEVEILAKSCAKR